jgi:2-dehydro-3-deoxyphosphooctonate aldolase (KDO 8-P synthase)
METHPRPDEALSDGPNMLALDDLPALVACCLRLRDALAPPVSDGSRKQ